MLIVSKDIKKNLLNSMLKIHKAEEKIVEVYAKEQQIRTLTHLSIGQEAVSAGLCPETHRGRCYRRFKKGL